ncbi:SPOR domain-containing protein [Flavobacterium nackdongense]|uniref:SPOR domain-containing protein n=1 Tax=Flavobacterium nackdongense TaxID=2547394 RepID=A0A4P6YFI1_9FLAO|nr:SPOR domain-containing protein [Flavobacterium nackdongense]QBN19664.1 SPOR domain-containing protein [Flavobacterium nackdongense]
MKTLITRKSISYLIYLGLFTCGLHAQQEKTSVSQDPKFEQLLNEKRKINASLTVNDSYKIQIYTGGSEMAKKTLTEFRQEFTSIDATIVFNTPNYKVWIGNFKTRIEAEKTMAAINGRYKNMLLIKPSR